MVLFVLSDEEKKATNGGEMHPGSGPGRQPARRTIRCVVRTHQEIDRRSLAMVRRVVAKIDADPERRGLAHAKKVCERWALRGIRSAHEWLGILERPWDEVRALLLDESEEGQRLRQTDPFCGILSPQERWQIYREAGSR
jgi:hypothetical protein